MQFPIKRAAPLVPFLYHQAAGACTHVLRSSLIAVKGNSRQVKGIRTHTQAERHKYKNDDEAHQFQQLLTTEVLSI